MKIIGIWDKQQIPGYMYDWIMIHCSFDLLAAFCCLPPWVCVNVCMLYAREVCLTLFFPIHNLHNIFILKCVMLNNVYNRSRLSHDWKVSRLTRWIKSSYNSAWYSWRIWSNRFISVSSIIPLIFFFLCIKYGLSWCDQSECGFDPWYGTRNWNTRRRPNFRLLQPLYFRSFYWIKFYIWVNIKPIKKQHPIVAISGR